MTYLDLHSLMMHLFLTLKLARAWLVAQFLSKPDF